MLQILSNFLSNRRLNRIRQDFKTRQLEFNTKDIDASIEALALDIYRRNQGAFLRREEFCNKSIGVFASELYDTGGHSPLVVGFSKSFYQDFNVSCFLTFRGKSVRKSGPKRCAELSKYVKIDGEDGKKYNVRKIISLYNKVIAAGPRLLVVYIHGADVMAVAVFTLLKRYTPIKILFFNHADHLSVLGMAFSDLILDFRPAGFKLTREIRGYDNNLIVDLQSVPSAENKIYSKEENIRQRHEWGNQPDDLISLTGCHASKLFEDTQSPYFEIIRDILKVREDLTHIVVSSFNDEQKSVIDEIFLNAPSARKRLKIVPFEAEFERLFQAADLFIDSFPQGSALTHIDCMRCKVPTVVKVNLKDEFKSFEHYLPVKYRFKYESFDAMKSGVLELLSSSDLRSRVGACLYKYYLERFEFGVVKKQYEAIIKETLL